MNSKPVTDNKEKAKSKKKKDPLSIQLERLDNLRYGKMDLSGEDLAAYADALAGATVALKAIEKTVSEAKDILKAAMLRQYCEHYAKTGRPPELRQPVSRMGTFQVIQQNTAKVTTAKVEELKGQGIDLELMKEKSSYTVRMGNASKEEQKKIISSLKRILGDGYEDVVSEHVHVGDTFFGKFDEVVKSSLGPDEQLDEKMLSVIRVLNPTVQFTKFKTDLPEATGYDLAFEFAQVSAQKKKAAESAAREAAAAKLSEERAAS
ncbi:MAG: hypothetical protein ACYTBS_11685 [Planctomycetota bacterium]|jgi:hypothetical protein